MQLDLLNYLVSGTLTGGVITVSAISIITGVFIRFLRKM